MADTAELDRPKTDAPDKIEATLNYLADTGGVPVTLVGDYGDSDTRTGGGQSDPHRVVIHNGRPRRRAVRPDRDGFSFVPHRTRIGDFFDDDQLRRVYYPEMEALIKAESGAKRVIVFDHTLRTEDERLRRERKIREVVRRVHNDYTEWSAPQRVRQIMARRGRGTSQGPLRDHPGVAAVPPPGRDLAAGDCRWAQHLRPRHGRDRAALSGPHRPDLRDGLQPGAPVVLVPAHAAGRGAGFQGLRLAAEGTVRWTAHTAFDDPTSPPNPPPRESIEIRTLAFF